MKHVRINRGANLMPMGAMIGLAACSGFGPPRTPPALTLPDHYVAADGHAGAQVAGTPAPTAPQDGASATDDWWRAFGSAELDAFVDEGLAASPSLAAAQATLAAARDGLRAQIGKSVLPSVDLGFSPSRQQALGLPILKQQTFLYDVFAAEVQTSYTFDFFGAALLADRSLARQVQQQALQFEALRRGLAANIVVATIQAAALQEQLDAATRAVGFAAERARQAEARERLGSLSTEDMLAAREAAANAAAAQPGLRAQLLAVRHAQAVLLGRNPDNAPIPLPLAALELPAAVPVAIPSELLHRRPDILAAEAAVRSSADAAGAAAASLFPSLTLSAAYGRGGFDWSTFASPAGALWSVGASLTQPLFHGGALRARQRQYEDLNSAAVAQYRQTVLAAFENVADTLAALEADREVATQTARAADAASRRRRDTTARQQLGALPEDASLGAGEEAENAAARQAQALGAQLADTAVLLDAMGETPAAMSAGAASAGAASASIAVSQK